MITFEFYGQSHGKGYGGTIKGLPNGFTFSVDYVNQQLKARKCGYGRSARQEYSDTVEFTGYGDTVTVNGNLEFFIANRSTEIRPEITALRSGHVDVVGRARFPNETVRNLNEIASARNSVCYVVLGAICKQLLESRGIYTYHYVERIGGISSRNRYRFGVSEQEPHFAMFHCPCKFATKLILDKIDEARNKGNTLGGTVAVGATGVPMGVGEILPYSERLDAQISANLVGIPSVKGITFGLGNKYADLSGVEAYDNLNAEDGSVRYASNNCGGIVAGISTGQDIVCHLTVKPIPTIKGVTTVDAVTLEPVAAHYERADTCVVPNVGVIGENILAYVICNQLIKQGEIK